MVNYGKCIDDDLIVQLKTSDRKAFEEIYNRYWKQMLALACLKIEDADESQEIVQQIFITLWERREELIIKSSLSGYLSVAVKYKIINTLNKRYIRRRHLENLPTTSFAQDSTTEWLEFEELQRKITKTIEELPEKCRLVFVLSRDQGLSQKKIAEKLQISEKTVEAHLGKAIKSLRSKLGANFFTFFLF